MVMNTPDDTVTARPTARIAGLDALRALAIIGMVYMHVSPTGWFTAVPFSEKTAVFSWFESIASNRAMSLFVLTAGISVALLSRRPGAGRRLAIRSGVLFLLSLSIDQLAGLNVSILEYYSLWLLLLIPLLRLPVRTLFGAAAVSAVVLPLFSFIVMNYGQEWPLSPFSGGPEATVGLRLLITPADWPAKLKSLLIGGGFQTPYAVPLLLAGLAVGRLDLQRASVRRRLALAGAALASLSWLMSYAALQLFGVRGALADMFSGTPPFQQPWGAVFALPPEQLYALSLTMGPFMFGSGLLLLSGLISVLERPVMQVLLLPLTSAGRLALTWYAAHLVFLHAGGSMPPYPFSLFAGMVLTVLVVSPLWCRRFRRGPLEGLTHRAAL